MSDVMPRTGSEISEIYARHLKTVYRVCYAYMKNPADTKDAVQDTFVRLIRSAPVFASEEHEKAWLIRTASNVCKNALRHWWRKRENIEDYTNLAGESTLEIDEVFQAVMALPEKYKTVVYLYYYEGYTGAEIADLLQKPASTVRNYLHEARGILRERLGEDFNEE